VHLLNNNNRQITTATPHDNNNKYCEYYYYFTRSRPLFHDNLGKLVYQKGKTSLDLNAMVGFWDGSGISWTTCKQSAPRSRQITTATPHRSIFTGWMLLLTPNQQCQSTEGTNKYC